jgi:hypothetical protein
MGEAFPDVTSVLVGLLAELGEADLAARLPRQGFYGRCDCKPGCRFVLTAPAGSSGSRMLWLEVGGEIVGEVSLDPDGRFVTNFELRDCAAVDIPPDWFDTANA